MFSLPKSNSASFNVDHFRSILLEDFPSKIRHGILRRKLLPSFLDFKQPTQAGGIPKLCPDFLTIYVQSSATMCRSRAMSYALFFVDIKQAFYRACRPLVTARFVSESQLVQLFQNNGWSPKFYQAFRDRLKEADALRQAGVSSHLQAQVNDLLTSTWFRMRGDSSTFTHTSAGTRPGDSVADLLFAFLMARYIHTIRSRFIEAGLHTMLDLKWIPACEFSSAEIDEQNIVQACWVDDLVLMFHSGQPDVLVRKLRCAAQIIQDTSVEYALQIDQLQQGQNIGISCFPWPCSP